jgi:hypothetical protein
LGLGAEAVITKHHIGLALLAAAVLATIIGIAPRLSVTTNAASTEIIGLDIFGLTKAAKDLPAQEYAAH